MFKKLFGVFGLTIALAAMPALAQQSQPVPPLPGPIKALQDEGAQLRYLGEFGGLNGWITVQNGQEQYFYSTEDGEAIVMGILFDKMGKTITLEQIKNLQETSGGVLDSLAVADQTPDNTESFSPESNSEFKTPAEQLYADISDSNWLTLGNENAPVIYSFIDPQCPHCKDYLKDLRQGGYLENGTVQLRVIPVGFKADSRAQAAFLLAAPNPERRLFNHVNGDQEALPVTADINQQGVERNISIMQAWQLDVTPLSVYKNAAGEVKIIQGRPKSLPDIIEDLN